MTATRRNGDKPFIISRCFAAARERVWRAWTERDELQRWFGPEGSTMPTCTLDLRPGGNFHYCLRMRDGLELWGMWRFREVVAPERLVLVMGFANALGGITRHPLSPTWPLEMLSTASFFERDGATTVEITKLVWKGTEEEHATFDAAHASMTQGWGGTFDRLSAYLAS